MPITKKASPLTSSLIKEAFLSYLLEHGKAPASIFAFAKSLKSTESEFYQFFNSLQSVEKDIWNGWMTETIEILENDAAYKDYTVREKMLSFYFSWMETLLANRSYVLMKREEFKQKKTTPDYLKSLYKTFGKYIHDLMLEGQDTHEVASRPFVGQYDKLFWLQLMFLTHFWCTDDSKNFEQTDAAIEKSVNFAFDLIAKGAFDSLLDLTRFLFQSRNNQ